MAGAGSRGAARVHRRTRTVAHYWRNQGRAGEQSRRTGQRPDVPPAHAGRSGRHGTRGAHAPADLLDRAGGPRRAPPPESGAAAHAIPPHTADRGSHGFAAALSHGAGDVFRGFRPVARVDRHLRSDLLFRQPAVPGDRYPHGIGRNRGPRAARSRRSDVPADGDWDWHRLRGRIRGRESHRPAAVRHRDGRTTRSRGAAGRADPGAPGRAHRPGGCPARLTRPLQTQPAYRPSISSGTAVLAAYSPAISISSGNPRSINSRPEPQRARAPGRSWRSRSKAAIAVSASGERVPGKCASTAPAPMRSSRPKRMVRSFQRSPAGMRLIRAPRRAASRATASQFRKQAVIVTFAAAAKLSSLPLGEGRTSDAPRGSCRKEPGASENLPERFSASSAPFFSANARAESSSQAYGNTAAPRETAMSTAVEKESTSTMITTSLAGVRCRKPWIPHSQRRSNSDWSNVTAHQKRHRAPICPVRALPAGGNTAVLVILAALALLTVVWLCAGLPPPVGSP